MEDKTCPICGTVNPSDSKFCANCGYAFSNVNETSNTNKTTNQTSENKSENSNKRVKLPVDPQILAPNINFDNLSPEIREKAELWTLYVQKNAHYYIPKFIQFYTFDTTPDLPFKDKLFSRFSWNWPALLFAPYWTAYRKMFLAVFVVIFLSFLLGLIFRILFATLANYIYYRHVNKQIEKIVIESKVLNVDPRLLAYKRGGTSVGAVFLILILEIFLIGFIVALATTV